MTLLTEVQLIAFSCFVNVVTTSIA
jgi:hypothetical protein